MPRKRFTNEQVAFALRQAENGATVDEICRRTGVSEPTFHRWKKQFVGMGVPEIRRLMQLEEGNGKLERLVADLTLDRSMRAETCSSEGGEVRCPPRGRRSPACGRRRACQATGVSRSSRRYRKHADPQVALRMRLKELVDARVRYGCRRLHILLRREGGEASRMRTYRIYRDEGLSIRPKLPKRKRAWRYRQGRSAIGGSNEVWATNFMSDRLFDGRPLRILAVVDSHIGKARCGMKPRPGAGAGAARRFGGSRIGRTSDRIRSRVADLPLR